MWQIEQIVGYFKNSLASEKVLGFGFGFFVGAVIHFVFAKIFSDFCSSYFLNPYLTMFLL